MKLKKGGISSIIVAIIIAGIVVALLITVVVPVSRDGTDLTRNAVDNLAETQPTMQTEQ